MEAKLVAEKSAKIRDWVSHKVQEVISSNQAHANEPLMDMLDYLLIILKFDEFLF